MQLSLAARPPHAQATTETPPGRMMRSVCAFVGALLAGFIVSPMLGIGTINEGVSLATFLVSRVGAVILLAIVNLFRRGRVR